jgi:hypothetical protein
MVSVWVVVRKDAMQTFSMRAISDHAFAYLLCKVLSMFERISLLLYHTYTRLSGRLQSGLKLKLNERNLTNDLLLSKKTSSFMVFASAKLENKIDLSSRLEAFGLLDLSASSSLAEA